MVVRVINFDAYEEWAEENGYERGANQLTDEQFMEIYEKEGGDWEFGSLADFADEFNTDGPYAPTPSSHIIRFFND